MEQISTKDVTLVLSSTGRSLNHFIERLPKDWKRITLNRLHHVDGGIIFVVLICNKHDQEKIRGQIYDNIKIVGEPTEAVEHVELIAKLMMGRK